MRVHIDQSSCDDLSTSIDDTISLLLGNSGCDLRERERERGGEGERGKRERERREIESDRVSERGGRGEREKRRQKERERDTGMRGRQTDIQR